MSAWIFTDRIVISAFSAVLLLAAASDAKSFRIPNLYSLILLLLYFIHIAIVPQSLPPALGVGAVVFALGAFLFSRGWMGGGDVKLLTVCALWAGAQELPLFVLVTAVVGALISLVMMSRYRFAVALAFEQIGCPRGSEVMTGRVVPYGIAIAAGGIAVAFALAAKTF